MGELFKGIQAGLKDAIAGRYVTYSNEPIKAGMFEIRQAQFEDLPEIARIHVKSWQQTYTREC